jgi:hypothetical protein
MSATEGGNSQETMNSGNISINPKGAILVWDLDKTLVAKYFNPANPASIEDPIINTNALRTMNTAFKSPNFSANMMLTNNGNLHFIQVVLFLITNQYNKMFPEEQVGSLFSVIYTAARNPDGRYKDPRVLDASAPESQRDPRYVAKRVEDVRNMCIEGEIPTDNLASRIFFFDDNTEHQMVTAGLSRGGISMRNYIQIEPPFNTVDTDRTNYGAVLEFLATRGEAAALANTVNMTKQSGRRKSRRKSNSVFRRTKRK